MRSYSIYYHHLILSIFEPLVDFKSPRGPSPRDIVASARQNLQVLIRLYYLRHGFDAMDLFIVIPLMLTAYQCLDAIDATGPVSSPATQQSQFRDQSLLEQRPGTPSSTQEQLEMLRSTLILVTKGLASQRRNHYLAEALYLVVRGRMRPEEVALLRGAISEEGEEDEVRTGMMQAVRSHWPVSVVRKKEDVGKLVLGKLLETYGGDRA